MQEILKIDGSFLEGGGQIVRTALALSSITGKSFEVNNIRKNRPQPGLKAQHVHCIKALEQLCDAKVEGAEIGSETLRFYPGILKAKNLSIDIGTAGSISLLMQSLLLPCLFMKKSVKLEITGGTDGKWAMPIDFFNYVFLPQIRIFSNGIESNMIKRGYYPKGNGKLSIKFNPLFKLNFANFDDFFENLSKSNKDYNLTLQKKLIFIKGVSHASRSLESANVSERQAKSAKFVLSKYNVPVDIRTEYQDTLSDGSGIVLWAVFSDKEEFDLNHPMILGSDILGEKGKKSEAIGEEAGKKLILEMESGACVDSHTADSLIPFMGLTPGSKIKTSIITNHCKTNIFVTEKFLPVKFNINNFIVECKHT